MSIPITAEKKWPEKLIPGDWIGVAAPSGAFKKEELLAGVRVLESFGFSVHIPENLLKKDRWFSGDDTTRMKILTDLFCTPEIKAIVCARGGYGAMRVLEQFDFNCVKDHPKIFAGFSDITALLVAFCERADLVTFHAPVLTQLGRANRAVQMAFYEMLTEIKTVKRHAINGVAVCPGRASGLLSGGNLTTLNHLLGTPFQPQLEGVVLVLEDIAEPPYKVDRMLTQMRLSGFFSGVQGIALGHFTDCGKREEINKIFGEQFTELDIPVISGFDFGHFPGNCPFPVGAFSILDSTICSLEYQL